MPEPTDDELGIPEGLDPAIRAELRKSRELQRDLEAERKAREQAQREAAFAKAGIPDTPLTTTLASTYTGENDPAAIKAYFEGLGVEITGTQQTPPPATGASEDDLAAQRRIAEATAGGDQGGSVDFADMLKSAGSQDEVLRLIASAPPGATDSNGYQIGAVQIQ